MLIETKGAIVASDKHYKAWARGHRKRFNNEMKFKLGKTPIRVYNPSFNVVPITKYSPLFDIFYPMVLRLQAGNIIEQLARFYYLDYFEEEEERELGPLQVSHLLTGTYACIIGLALAILAFIVEKVQGSV